MADPITVYKDSRSIQVAPELLQEALGKGWSQIDPASMTPKGPSGFFGRLAESLGVPTSKKELQAMQPDAAEGILGPPMTAGRMAVSYGKGLYQGAKKAGGEIIEAQRNVSEGGPLIPNLKKAAYATENFVVGDMAAPVGGRTVQNFGEDVARKNYSGAAGGAVGTVINALLLKGASKPTGEMAANKFAFAADLKTGIEDAQQVLPDIQRHLPTANPTVQDTVTAINKAKDGMNTEAGIAMQPIAGKEFVPTEISDRIKSHITPDMAKAIDGNAVAGMFKKFATQFEKPWTFKELDALRMRWWAEIKGFEEMAPADKTAYAKAHPEVAAMAEAVDAIRDIVYPAMDRATGKPEGYFANLKGRQSTLIHLQKVLEKRVDTLTTMTKKIHGAPRLSQENVSIYGTQRHTGFSAHRLQNIIKKPNPLGEANAAMSRAFTGRPIPKALLYSLPVRTLLMDEEPEQKPKTPAQMKKDISEIRDRYTPQSSSNPFNA